MKTISGIRNGRRGLTALLVVMALTLTALGGSFIAGAGAKGASSSVVINQAFKYRPGTIHVHAGTTVDFKNVSSYTHTATAANGAFDTGHIKPGGSKQVTLAKKGTIVFHCDIHPFMTGKIVVE